MVFAILIGLGLLVGLISPFVFGEGGPLQAGSTIQDPGTLISQKKAVLKRYIADEKAQEEGLISKTEWNRKKQFLINRYIDASRRIDFLTNNNISD